MLPDRLPLAQQHRGEWRAILAGLGVPSAALVDRHGPCPVCGGRDRFRFDDKRGEGTFICSQCGAGDGPKLAMLFLGCDFKQLLDRMGRNEPGEQRAVPAMPKVETDEAKRHRMNRLWGKALPIRSDDPAGIYLTHRLGRFPARTGLRFHPACPYPQGEDMPAMLAIYAGADGTPSGLHRTYLTSAGRKARLVAPKLSLGPLVDGGAVRLAPAGKVLGIAEGIETALAASILFDVPCWAALNANRLATWVPPEGVEQVRVFADNDESFTGQTAAFDLQARLEADGLRVEIETPATEGRDWADELFRE